MKAGWTTVKLGEIAEIYNGNTVSDEDKKRLIAFPNAGLAFIATKDVGFDGVINYDNGINIPGDEAGDFKVARKNAVLVCAEGGSAGRKIGHIDRDVHFGNKLFALNASSAVLPRYLYHYCLSEDFRKKFKGLMAGLIGGVSVAKFKQIEIPLPPLAEQKRIVALLDEAFAGIDAAKAKAEESLRLAHAAFKAQLQSAFGRRGPNWVDRTLEEVSTTFGRGKSKHRPRNAPHLYGGKYPFIQTGDIRSANHTITEYSQTYSDAGLAQSKLWPKGTICITIAANIAETAILDFDACFPDSVIGVVADPKIADIGYIEYVLQSLKARLQSMGKGSAQANINMGTFENERFPFPPVAEQRKMVSLLDTLSIHAHELAGLYEAKEAALSELKNSLLSQAFAGELTA